MQNKFVYKILNKSVKYTAKYSGIIIDLFFTMLANICELVDIKHIFKIVNLNIDLSTIIDKIHLNYSNKLIFQVLPITTLPIFYENPANPPSPTW